MVISLVYISLGCWHMRRLNLSDRRKQLNNEGSKKKVGFHLDGMITQYLFFFLGAVATYNFCNLNDTGFKL